MGVSGVVRRDSLVHEPRRTLVAAVVGVVVTLGILYTPYLTFGVQSPQSHLVLNTLDAAIGLLAAFLLYGRLVRQRHLQDLLVMQGLALLVVTGLGLNNLVDALGERPGTLDVWLPLSVRVMGAVFIAAAALVGPRRELRRRGWVWSGLTLALVVSVLPVLGWAWISGLPVALDLSVTPESAQHPVFAGHPLLLTAQAFAAVCFAVAAVLFSRQASAVGDNELLRWLGPACAFGAVARFNYFLFPSLYTDWLYTGDLLRTGFYVLLLVGASLEIRRFWSDRAELAVLDDRRRLARELHDGVIQELSFIKAQGVGLEGDPGVRRQILGACDRALEEARAAVVALGAQGDEPFSTVLERATGQLAVQYGVEVTTEIDDGVSVDGEERHALVRIAREAITNAVKHGGARHIQVVLRGGPNDRHLAVRDDGRGFDTAAVLQGRAASGAGYGLVSMRDRARGLGGMLHIESSPGAGSLVKVTW